MACSMSIELCRVGRGDFTTDMQLSIFGKGVESAGEKTDFMLKVVPFLNFLFSVKISLLCFLRKLRKLFLPPIHEMAFSEKERCFERYHHLAKLTEAGPMYFSVS